MRVTDSMVWNNQQRAVANRQTGYARAQQQALTGKRVNAPSDDPASFAQARSETGNIVRAEGYERTINLTRPSLEVADSALSDIENVMRRVRDIAVQGANDPLNASDRNTLSQELTALRDELITLGNSHSGDRFVFGGYKDGAPPYDAAGVYTGDTEAPRVEISRGVTLPMGVTGDSVFGTPGDDVFTTITNLQTALASGDGANISSMITEVDQRFERVRVVHSEIGVHQNAADIAQAVVQRGGDAAAKNRSALVDIDAAESYSNLIRAQSALSAAIEIASQLPMPGLASRSR
ncbi:MAG: flagellar hook-associated protein FlgL [Polyangiales bacterium]